jgi:hypothetical protein
MVLAVSCSLMPVNCLMSENKIVRLRRYLYLGSGGISGQNVGGYDPLNAGLLRVTFFPIRMPDAALADFMR